MKNMKGNKNKGSGLAVEGSSGSGMGMESISKYVPEGWKSVVIYDTGESYEKMRFQFEKQLNEHNESNRIL